MSKKTLKIVGVIAIIISIVMLASTCFALEPKDINGNANINTGIIQNAGNQIATIIRTVGIVASVIILMILGIKYMMGSAEEKAEYKKTMIPYVVGAILLFAATTIANAVFNFPSGIGK